MGYTHYWSLPRKASPRRWARFTDVVRRLLAHPTLEPHLCWEHDQPDRPPQVDDDLVRFNGKGEMGYETFLLENRGGRDGGGFCKTAFEVNGSHRPYDVAVCALLIAAAKHLGADVSSDGEWSEPGWLMAREVYREVTGEEPACPWG